MLYSLGDSSLNGYLDTLNRIYLPFCLFCGLGRHDGLLCLLLRLCWLVQSIRDVNYAKAKVIFQINANKGSGLIKENVKLNTYIPNFSLF